MLELTRLNYVKEITTKEVDEIVRKLVEQCDENCTIILAPGDMDDIAQVINEFPEFVGPDELIGTVKFFEETTGVIESGFWWELIEYCLAKRIGSSKNCLA